MDRDRGIQDIIPARTSTSTRRTTRRGMGMDKDKDMDMDRGTMRTSSSNISRDMGMHQVRVFLVLDAYGLTWTTDPPSGYYGSYVPGAPYPGGPSGSGGGGLQGGIASALQAVEGIAGRQTRLQLEKTVKSLSGCRLFFGGGVLTCFCSGEL